MYTRCKIWILEDESSCQFVYNETLSLKYDLSFYGTVGAFREALKSKKQLPDLVIADLKLPDEPFLKFLAHTDMESVFSIPFIVVSSMDDSDVLRICFDEGALDYLTKPFSKAELSVKVSRLLNDMGKIEGPDDKNPYKIDALSLNVIAENGKTVKLTHRELQIFSVLRSAKQGPVSRKEIVIQVWGNINVSSKTLDVHIFNLRKKMVDTGIKINFHEPNSFSISSNRVEQDIFRQS